MIIRLLGGILEVHGSKAFFMFVFVWLPHEEFVVRSFLADDLGDMIECMREHSILMQTLNLLLYLNSASGTDSRHRLKLKLSALRSLQITRFREF